VLHFKDLHVNGGMEVRKYRLQLVLLAFLLLFGLILLAVPLIAGKPDMKIAQHT